MCAYKSVFIVSLLIFATTAQSNTKDAIGFPEMEENPDLKNKDNRQPVYLPAMCPENELYYPGDQKDDWICDCRPSFLYHPTSDSCWPAFKRGPCGEGQYLTLPQNSVIPTCEMNPCVVDGFVQWNSKCEKLGSVAPCNFMRPISAALGVNATTLVVSCVRQNVVVLSRFGEETSPARVVRGSGCSPGSKRNIGGKCVSVQ